jgi:hypothetical protein
MQMKVAKLTHKLPAFYGKDGSQLCSEQTPYWILPDPQEPCPHSQDVSTESSQFTAVIRGDYSLLDPTKITQTLLIFSRPVSSRSMSTLFSQVRPELQRSLPFWNSDYYSQFIPVLPEVQPSYLPSVDKLSKPLGIKFFPVTYYFSLLNLTSTKHHVLKTPLTYPGILFFTRGNKPNMHIVNQIKRTKITCRAQSRRSSEAIVQY